CRSSIPLIHRAIAVVPLTFDFDIGFVHPPTDPHWALAPVERLLQLGTILDHPAVDGRAIHVDPGFQHEFFDMARAQGIRHIPAYAHENDLVWKMRLTRWSTHDRNACICGDSCT